MTRVKSEKASALRVLTRFPDRVVVRDPELVEYLGAALTESDALGDPYVSMHDFHRLREPLASWLWNDDAPAPEWLDRSFDESEWAAKSVREGGSVAWVFGTGRAIVQAPYTMSLADRLDGLASPYRFSTLFRGWVVSRLDVDAEALSSILDDYGITRSIVLADALEGRSGWKDRLAATVEAGRARGIEARSSFASGRTYKPHQVDAVVAMAHQGATLLGDQVGLGKGGEFVGGALSLEDLAARESGPSPYPVLLAVTKSMKDEIVEEILRWKSDARVEVIEGTKSSPLDPTMNFYVVNHDILNNRLADILDARPRGFVADEAHVYKNEGAKRTQAAQAIADAVRAENPENPYVVMATGTPFLNSPIELWSIASILGIETVFSDYAIDKLNVETTRIRTRNGWSNKRIWPKRAFEMYFCRGYYDRFGAWHADGASNTNELHRLLIETGMVRRRKSDVMHPLPELREALAFADPSDEGWAEYRRVEEEFREWMIERAIEAAEEEGVSREEALRIVVSKLDSGGEGMMRLTALRRTLARIKVDSTVEWIHRFMDGSLTYKGPGGEEVRVGDDPERRKVIVFGHFKDERRLLVEHPDLQQYGVVTILPGDEQDGKSIQEHKRLFQAKSDDHRLMICTQAAREGHTLTAARDIIIHDVPFVPSWVVQMAGRCWARISEAYEPHEATIHYMIAKGTEDERSIQRIRVKKAVFDAVIDAEGQDQTISDIQEEAVDVMIDAFAIGEKELTVAR